MRPAIRCAVAAYLLLEAFLILEIASRLGAGRTLMLLLLAAAAGIMILRRQQLSMLARLRQTIAAGKPLLPGVLDSGICAVAGLMLIIPGFISDAAAAGLLIPAVRRGLVRRLSSAFGDVSKPGPVVIDGDYRRVDATPLPEPKRGPR